MKKFLVICAALALFVACGKDAPAPATDTAAADVSKSGDVVSVAEDVTAVDVAAVATPDASSPTDVSTGD